MTPFLFPEMTLTVPAVNFHGALLGWTILFCIFLRTGVPKHARTSIYDISTFYITVYFKTTIFADVFFQCISLSIYWVNKGQKNETTSTAVPYFILLQ